MPRNLGCAIGAWVVRTRATGTSPSQTTDYHYDNNYDYYDYNYLHYYHYCHYCHHCHYHHYNYYHYNYY